MTKDRKAAWVAMEKLVPLVLKVFPKHPWLTFPPRPPRPRYCESDGLVVVFILCSLYKTRSVPVSGAIRVDCVTGGGGGIVGGGECPPQGSHAAWVENQEPHLTNRRTTFWKHCLPPPSSGDSAFLRLGVFPGGQQWRGVALVPTRPRLPCTTLLSIIRLLRPHPYSAREGFLSPGLS